MLFALAVLALFRSRSKASTLSYIFFEATGSIDRADELQGPGFVNCKCFGDWVGWIGAREESGVHEREGWAWIGWVGARDESGVRVGWFGAREESGVHEREGWAWVGT